MTDRHRDRARLAVLAVFVAAAALATLVPAAAHPPDETDHGIETETFDALWSRDDPRNVTRNSTVQRFMTETSDVTFVEPPKAPVRWTRGEHDELGEAFDSAESDHEATYTVHPEGVEPRDDPDSDIIRDAYADVFAVVPSAIVHEAPGRVRHVVPADGELLGVVDYRVELPGGPGPCSDPELEDYKVEETTVETRSGQVRGTGEASQTPRVGYSDLAPQETRLLTFAARIRVDYKKQTGPPTCSFVDETETMRVTDTIDVEPASLSSLATFARYPDDDVGVFAFNQNPWRGFELPDGTRVLSPFRFFSARRTDWDETDVRKPSGPVPDIDVHTHPLRVHAYPSKRGTRIVGPSKDRTSITDTVGATTEPPEMPHDVAVDNVSSNYSLPQAYGVRYGGPTRGDTTALPLYPGSGESVRPAGEGKTIRESALAISTVSANASNVTIDVSLTEAGTGDGIETAITEGYVAIQGDTRVNTSGDGSATVTIDRPTGAVRAEYVPAPWWEATRAHTGTSTAQLVTERAEATSIPDTLVRFLGLMAPFLAMIYMLDRAFGLDVWPPWREL